MQQTESSKLTLEDKRELEAQRKEQEEKVKKMSMSRAAHHDISISTADYIMREVKELRRLRRLR